MNIITILVFGGILSYTISSLIDKKLATIPGNSSRFSAALYKLPVTSFLFILLMVYPWRGAGAYFHGGFLTPALLLGILLGLGFEFYFRALSRGQASTLFPFLLSTSVALTSVLAALLFNEIPSLIRVLGILGVVGGNVLLVRSEIGATGNGANLSLPAWIRAKRSGFIYFGCVVILGSVEHLLKKLFSFSVEDGFALIGWTYIFAMVTLLIFNGSNLAHGIKEYLGVWKLFLKHWFLLCVGAFTGLLGNWLFYTALRNGGDASYVFPLGEGGELPLLTIATAIIFREKMPPQKVIAVAVLFLSVLAIVLSS